MEKATGLIDSVFSTVKTAHTQLLSAKLRQFTPGSRGERARVERSCQMDE